MTTSVVGRTRVSHDATALVAVNSEEAHALLRRAILVRHGETEWTLSGQHTGATDIPLTEHGRAAARQLAPLAAKARFALVLTSPLGRARETCQLAGLAEQAEVDSNLREWNYGDYEGLTRQQIHALDPGWMLFTAGCPGGESPAEVAARVDQVIARIRNVDGDVALFAHGHLFRVFAARWLGLPPQVGNQFLLDPATISVMSHYRGAPAIKCWNAPFTF